MDSFIRHGGLPPKYQCDLVVNKTYDEWLNEGEVHLPIGIGSLIYGIIGVILYIPCCRVLLSPDLWNITAYKLLFLISILQIITLFQNSILAGIFFIMGIVYCNYPHLNYLVGCTVMFTWTGVCCSCFLLCLSRLIDLWKSEWHDFFFGGKRVLISVAIVMIHGTSFWLYCSPTAFNSRQMTWHFDPMVYPDGSHFQDYASFILVLNNEGIVSLSLLLSVVFVASFIVKSYWFNYQMSATQKQLFLQTCISSVNNLTTATIYVSYGFIEGGKLLNYLGLLTWQLSACGELVMFLAINQTVRTRVLQLLGLKKGKIYMETQSALRYSSRH